jgi:hypothetical protein
MRKTLLLLALVVMAALLSLTALAGEPQQSRTDLEALAGSEDPNQAAAALFALGELDEADGDYPRALRDYSAVQTRYPSGRYAPRATTRADVLRAHSEGDFAPFARLERIRRDPNLANDPAAIDALARDAAGFPPGPTRSEARLLAAEAYLGRLDRHADAIAQLREVVADPKAEVLLSRQAARQIIEARIAEGDVVGARDEAHAMANKLDPKLVRQTDRLVRRQLLHRVAVSDLAMTAVLVVAAIAIAARHGRLPEVGRALRAAGPTALAFAAFVGLAGGALASSYESGNATPFRVLGVALLPLVLCARAWGAAGSPARGARVGRAFACASAAVACAFVVLEAVDPTYLDGFGL